MAGRRSILLFWALLMVPVLILAGVAFRVLRHEQARILSARNAALLDQARTAAGKIDLTVETVQNNLTAALIDLPADDLENRLLSWETQNPLVRNVFIYDQQKGLLFPKRSMAATREERRFTSRFSKLFSGEIPFDFEQVPIDGERVLGVSKNLAAKELYALSRKQDLPAYRSGWIPWFSDSHLYVLGWVQKEKHDPVYGVELELMTLLSRLTAAFPKPLEKGAALVLMDGSGTPLHQTGRLTRDKEGDHIPFPDQRIMISSHLPHWSVAVYPDKHLANTGNQFMALSLILLGVLLTAIVTGGIMITRLTLEKIRDARQKTSFVSSVSHELKTPLTSIRMYAELLQSKRVMDPVKQARYLDVIVGESGRLTRLINNVLDFGKLEQGKKQYNPVTFDMKLFLTDMIATHALRIQNTGFKVVKSFQAGQFLVTTDRDAMEQALLNLLDNALKYAEGGTCITFILERKDNHILAKLADDGPGIPAHAGESIFEKFYRADTSLTTSRPGSGLGLSIARQLLRDQGADLYLDTTGFSKNPAGACFTIRIPIHETD